MDPLVLANQQNWHSFTQCGHCQEDLLRAMADRDGWRERLKGICTNDSLEEEKDSYKKYIVQSSVLVNNGCFKSFKMEKSLKRNFIKYNSKL